MKRFALAGNPNCGKTTLFNNLTGSTAHVGNWPGVTVDKKEGTYKKCKEPISIIDLPGIYSLSPYTPEEVITRNYILNEKPDCIINIIDATNLERNLYLTTQILEIDVPVVIALNMMDAIKKNGEKIDVKQIETILGVSVVDISALKNDNVEVLMEKAYQASLEKRNGNSVLVGTALNHLIGDVKIAFDGMKVENSLFHAIKLVELDDIEVNDHKDLVHVVEDYKKTFSDSTFGSDFEAIVADSRYKFISKQFGHVKTNIEGKTKNQSNKEKTKRSDKIDRVLTNRFLGIPIFLIILFLVFHLTFSENLFYLGGLFKNVSPSFEGSMFEGLIWTDAGINSPGVILFNFLDSITGGFIDVVAGWLESSSPWVSGLICDGVLGGIFAVLGFLPQILLLFLFFSILEDTGYMARVAFILDRIFRKFGLSGRAFMPMIMGFGCSIPAMINTRTLADEKERTATLRVIPFFSCGAKLPILTAIAGAICQVFDFSNVDIITYSMYLVGIITAIVAIIIMRNTTMRGSVPPFIMELPTYHVPQFKSLMIHLWDKLKHFVKKAFTIILASTIVIWFLQSFTFNWKFIEQASVTDITDETFAQMLEDDEFSTKVKELNEEYVIEGDEQITFGDILADKDSIDQTTDNDIYMKYETVTYAVYSNALNEFKAVTEDSNYIDTSDSILAGLGKLIQPIFTPLGFGSNLDRENGWVFGVSAVTGLIAKENVIATFSVLAECTSNQSVTDVLGFEELYLATNDEEGVNASVQMINNAGVGDNYGILIAFIIFNMTTIPCFAAVATAKAESPTKKSYKMTLLFWVATSFIVSMMAFLVLTWWWTAFIYAALIIIMIIAIRQFNKKKDKRLANL